MDSGLEKGEMRHSVSDNLVIENVFPAKYIMNLEMGVKKKASLLDRYSKFVSLIITVIWY